MRVLVVNSLVIGGQIMRSDPVIPAWLRQAAMPVIYGRIFVDVALERGANRQELFRRARLSPSQLDDPAGRLSALAFTQLVAAVLDVAGDDALGFETGLRQPLTAHGSLGLALMCCATVADAIQVLQRFWYLRGRGFGMTAGVEGDYAMVVLHAEMPLAPALCKVLSESIVASIYRGLCFLLTDVPACEIWFTHESAPVAERYSGLLPEVRFSRSVTALRVPRLLLDRPLPTASPETLHLALQQCERELAILGDATPDLLHAARHVMVPGTHGYPSADALAEQLHMTGRTLRRRLQQANSSYKQLLEDARRRDAMSLLDQLDLSVQTIATLLGYQDPANFTRAFRGWTGKTPTQYRRMRGAV